MECYAPQKVLSIKNDSISNHVLVSIFHYKTRVRLMFDRPSRVDAQLVHYKAQVRLMFYRPSMVDAQPVHYKARGKVYVLPA